MANYFNLDVMSRKEIWNARRSAETADYVNVKVDINTTEATLNEILTELREFLAKNPREFRPTCMMDLMEMGQTNDMMTVRFSIDMNSNWQDGGKRWMIRTKYMFKLKDLLLKKNIRFIVPVQEVKLIGEPTVSQS